jgi:hypothetical protein
MLFILKEVALLPGRFHDDKDRLSLAFEVERAAAISEICIVSDVIVGAVDATCWLVVRFDIHRRRFLAKL